MDLRIGGPRSNFFHLLLWTNFPFCRRETNSVPFQDQLSLLLEWLLEGSWFGRRRSPQERGREGGQNRSVEATGEGLCFLCGTGLRCCLRAKMHINSLGSTLCFGIPTERNCFRCPSFGLLLLLAPSSLKNRPEFLDAGNLQASGISK